MEMLSSGEQPSFYCNHCDRWVDGMQDKEEQVQIAGMKQVLCEECGNAILYQTPTLWGQIRRRVGNLFANTFGRFRK